MSPEPTLPVSQPDPIQQAENWLLTRRNYVGQQVKHRGDCGKGVVNHACELCRLSIMLPTYANYLDSARDRELQQAREANELIQGQMRTLNEECAQLRKDCVRSGEEIARLKEALTKS